jgi:hypothetical protein
VRTPNCAKVCISLSTIPPKNEHVERRWKRSTNLSTGLPFHVLRSRMYFIPQGIYTRAYDVVDSRGMVELRNGFHDSTYSSNIRENWFLGVSRG